MHNYFDADPIAERYASARPAFHRHVMARLRALLGSQLPLERALDVACGTGHSTLCLEGLSPSVVGLDSSLSMLRRAPAGSHTMYVAGSAEDLPFRESGFDLLTVSSAFHWFDQDRFLREATRVLRSGGTLVVYDNYFSGNAVETDAVAKWVFETYRSKYPGPPRAAVVFDTSGPANGFLCTHREEYENIVPLSLQELTEYLLTQTNTIAALEGGTPLPELRQWLLEELRPYFEDGPLRVRFRGPIWILQREA